MPKPKDNYVIACISLYNEDDDYLNSLVEDMRGHGVANVTRSSLIRAALRVVDFDELMAAMKKKRY